MLDPGWSLGIGTLLVADWSNETASKETEARSKCDSNIGS